MSAVDSLDDLENIDNTTGKPSPTTARSAADAVDPEMVVTARSKRWEAIIPDGVDGKLRTEMEAALDVAHFAMGWPVNKLASLTLDLSSRIAEEKGAEPDDPKVARSAAVQIIKTIEAAALSQNPFADATPALERYINKTSAYARTLGWSPEQIGLTLKSALVQTEGAKLQAAGLFASYVIDEAHERGHKGSRSLESLQSYADRGSDLLASEDPTREDYTGVDLEDDRTASVRTPDDAEESLDSVQPEQVGKPANAPYASDHMVTVYDSRDDANTLQAYAMRADQLQSEVHEREVRGRAADKKLAIVDKIAATVLKKLDYATYRIMRDEAYRVNANADVDMPLSRVVQDQLKYDKLQGADLAIKRVQKALAEAGLKDVSELSEQARQRIAMPTEQAIADGVATKPRRKPQDLE